jgi:toxin-antitoxin system, antitoxin component, xre family
LRSFTGNNLDQAIFKTLRPRKDLSLKTKTVYRIEDVAAYILVRQTKPCEAMKIQKLCYYAQAWYLTRYGVPLFIHDFEAWRSGPVSPSLYKYHAGMIDFPADRLLKVAEPDALSQEGKMFIDKVLAVYGRYTGLQLRNIAQNHDPWKNTREAYMSHQINEKTISTQSIINYYSQFLN